MSTDGETARRRPGPRRSLSHDQVVGVALEAIDAGGPEALSIRAVAARLGVNPNAVYTYVASRNALEREVVERVFGETDLDLLTGPPHQWRQRIIGYARSLRAAVLRHPPVATLMMTAPMDGPSAVLIGERLIAALRDGGLPLDAAARGTYALIVQVVGFVALEVAETDARPPLPSEADRVAARRAALEFLDPAQWPLSAATRDVAAAWISTDQFNWSVERLLDGMIRPGQ
ncbi:TetR/AcrR family transcriptional regulator C-terminal domain-containing protein [Nakamurella sp.]|uniref:TetR/AcrR family transcriptional regulator C-terminal domain-containing protein n=1 Tax=Nakamurella sp. TaxID=1869182 RepID=UPI0037830B70